MEDGIDAENRRQYEVTRSWWKVCFSLLTPRDWELSEVGKSQFVTCKCISEQYLSIRPPRGKWQHVTLERLSKATVLHARHHIYSAPSFHSCQFMALQGMHLMTTEKAQPFPGPASCSVSTACQGHIRLNLHYLWGCHWNPPLNYFPNFHKKLSATSHCENVL